MTGPPFSDGLVRWLCKAIRQTPRTVCWNTIRRKVLCLGRKLEVSLRSFSALQMDSFEYFSGDLDLNRANTMMANTPKLLHLTAMKPGALQPG